MHLDKVFTEFIFGLKLVVASLTFEGFGQFRLINVFLDIIVFWKGPRILEFLFWTLLFKIGLHIPRIFNFRLDRGTLSFLITFLFVPGIHFL